MQKTYVLDTNVLIQAPHALRCFEDNRVVLPLAVLEELDGLKNSEGERGANARQAIRFLETLRDCGYDGPLSIEQEDYTIPLEEALDQAVSLLRQVLPA